MEVGGECIKEERIFVNVLSLLGVEVNSNPGAYVEHLWKTRQLHLPSCQLCIRFRVSGALDLKSTHSPHVPSSILTPPALPALGLATSSPTPCPSDWRRQAFAKSWCWSHYARSWTTRCPTSTPNLTVWNPKQDIALRMARLSRIAW